MRVEHKVRIEAMFFIPCLLYRYLPGFQFIRTILTHSKIDFLRVLEIEDIYNPSCRIRCSLFLTEIHDLKEIEPKDVYAFGVNVRKIACCLDGSTRMRSINA